MGNPRNGFDGSGRIGPDHIIATVRAGTTHERLLIGKHNTSPIAILLLGREAQPPLLVAISLQRHCRLNIGRKAIIFESEPQQWLMGVPRARSVAAVRRVD